MCHLPKKIGTCRAAYRRYYFDAATGKCLSFAYGGCKGNQNNFESIEECKAACEGTHKSSNYLKWFPDIYGYNK